MWFEIGKKYLYYSLWSVHDGANVNNMTQLIIEALSKKDMTKKLISSRVNGIIVFQGICNGVKMQIQEKYALHKHGNANSKPFIFNFKVKKSTSTIVCIFHS
jgi:hypothetical protein